MSLRFSPPGSFKSAEDFQAQLQDIDPSFSCDKAIFAAGPLSQPIHLHALGGASTLNRTIGNRFAIHPMEGWDGTLDGRPSEHTLRRWKRFGQSGAKLIWGGEAVAVRPDGRANPNQLFHDASTDNVAKFTQLREQILAGHLESFSGQPDATNDLVIGLQLTHSGRFSKPNGPKFEPKIAFHHPLYSQKFHTPDDLAVLTDDELKHIRDGFILAAKSAQAAGFDFVDIKCCHGYLLHELLSARTRSGSYGGDWNNRTRMFVEIVEGIQSECPGLEIGTRLGLTDLPPFVAGENGTGRCLSFDNLLPYELGFGMEASDPLQPDFDEPFQFLRLLQEYKIRLVNISIGTPYSSPHLQRPATYPPSDGYLPPVDPLLSVFRQLQAVRLVKQQFEDLILVGSGYSYLQDYLPHVAQYEVSKQHTDLVGLGRMVLSYPELPLDVLAGKELARKKICRTFSDCTTGPRNQIISGCFPLDPHYKLMPEARQIKELRRETARRLNDS